MASVYSVVAAFDWLRYAYYARPGDVQGCISIALGTIVYTGVMIFGVALIRGGIRVHRDAPGQPIAIAPVAGALGFVCLALGIPGLLDYRRYHSALCPMTGLLTFAASSLIAAGILVAAAVAFARPKARDEAGKRQAGA